MKIQISLATPTSDGPEPKGWRVMSREVVEQSGEQTIEEIMEILVDAIEKGT